MRQITNVNPLITNFMIPNEMASDDDIKVIYDPQKQITFLMGGQSSSTRSDHRYKTTSKWTRNGYIQDSPTCTDD